MTDTVTIKAWLYDAIVTELAKHQYLYSFEGGSVLAIYGDEDAFRNRRALEIRAGNVEYIEDEDGIEDRQRYATEIGVPSRLVDFDGHPRFVDSEDELLFKIWRDCRDAE